MTFDIVRRLVATDRARERAQLQEAIAGIVREERLIAEGAARRQRRRCSSGAVESRSRGLAVILSGANIDLETLKTLI